jgi:hypothetical protein
MLTRYQELVLSILSEAPQRSSSYSNTKKCGYSCQKRALDLPGDSQVDKSLPGTENILEGSPARKRIRLSKNYPESPPSDVLQTLLETIYNILGCESSVSLDELPSIAQ